MNSQTLFHPQIDAPPAPQSCSEFPIVPSTNTSVVPWSEFPVVPSNPRYPHPRPALRARARVRCITWADALLRRGAPPSRGGLGIAPPPRVRHAYGHPLWDRQHAVLPFCLSSRALSLDMPLSSRCSYFLPVTRERCWAQSTAMDKICARIVYMDCFCEDTCRYQVL